MLYFADKEMCCIFDEGHYGQGERGSVTNDASWIHRFDMFTHL